VLVISNDDNHEMALEFMYAASVSADMWSPNSISRLSSECSFGKPGYCGNYARQMRLCTPENHAAAMRLAQLVARSEDQARVSIQPSYLQREQQQQQQQQQQPATLRANGATSTTRENVCRMTLMVPPVIPSIDEPLLPRYVFADKTPHADDRQGDSMATREREYLEHVYCLLANAATSVRAQSAGQACGSLDALSSVLRYCDVA